MAILLEAHRRRGIARQAAVMPIDGGQSAGHKPLQMYVLGPTDVRAGREGGAE